METPLNHMNTYRETTRPLTGSTIRRKGSQIEIQDVSHFIRDYFSSGSTEVRFDYFLLIHVMKGSGNCRVGRRTIYLKSDSFCYVYPGQVIIPEVDMVIEGTVIKFTPEFLSSSKDEVWALLRSDLFSIYRPCNMAISDGTQPEIRQYIQTMTREYSENRELCHEVLRSLLRILIIMLGRGSSERDVEGLRRREVDQVNAFYELVNKNLVSLKKVSEYARLLAISCGTLNALIKKVSGFTARHYVQQQIILEAKRQILWEGKSLKEIAYSLGFVDISHFSRFFKNVAGINFSDFRSSNPI